MAGTSPAMTAWMGQNQMPLMLQQRTAALAQWQAGRVSCEASNAQRKQSHRADPENQDEQRDRIIIEPMSTLCMHDNHPADNQLPRTRSCSDRIAIGGRCGFCD
jgi:hypothetical protein